MNWYSADNVHIIYLSSNNIGIYLELGETNKISQIFITDKLFKTEKLKSQGFTKPKKDVSNKIWDQVIKHPNWDKMLVTQVFEKI